MKFTPDNLERIRQALVPFHGLVGHNKTLPAHLRRPDYHERMKRQASVLVPLVNVNGEASVLFTLRSQHITTHKGQVSFPGGHLDSGESHVQGALRELEEETKLKARVLGQYKSARAYTGSMVTPVVGVLDDMTSEEVVKAGTHNPKEVESAFVVPLKRLFLPALRETEDLASFRATRFLGGEHVVWGLTAFLLENVCVDVIGPAMGMEYAATARHRESRQHRRQQHGHQTSTSSTTSSSSSSGGV